MVCDLEWSELRDAVTRLYPCSQTGQSDCSHRDDFDGYVCTREVGHIGPHVAHGGDDRAIAILTKATDKNVMLLAAAPALLEALKVYVDHFGDPLKVARAAIEKAEGWGMREETIPAGVALWQSDTAKTYKCSVCLRPLFSQYEGDEEPRITCRGPMQDHVLTWTVKP